MSGGLCHPLNAEWPFVRKRCKQCGLCRTPASFWESGSSVCARQRGPGDQPPIRTLGAPWLAHSTCAVTDSTLEEPSVSRVTPLLAHAGSARRCASPFPSADVLCILCLLTKPSLAHSYRLSPVSPPGRSASLGGPVELRLRGCDGVWEVGHRGRSTGLQRRAARCSCLSGMGSR